MRADVAEKQAQDWLAANKDEILYGVDPQGVWAKTRGYLAQANRYDNHMQAAWNFGFDGPMPDRQLQKLAEAWLLDQRSIQWWKEIRGGKTIGVIVQCPSTSTQNRHDSFVAAAYAVGWKGPRRKIGDESSEPDREEG